MACSPTPNRIVLENQLPGTPSTAWDINGAGHPAIVGFATRASVAAGETAAFKLRLARDEPFRVDIYRLGYYGGAGARLVGVASPTAGGAAAAAAQPACVAAEEEARLVDCGNWAVVAEFRLAANATSGLYFGRAVALGPHDNWRADGSRVLYDPRHAIVGADPRLPPDGSLPHAYAAAGRNKLRNRLEQAHAFPPERATHMWFVVRDATSTTHDLLFQTSDTTWHAYNGYGGYTTYGSFDYPFEHAPSGAPLNLSEEGHDLRRAYKRSYNTPLITRDYRSVNTPLANEYPAIRFLERNGYDVHYAAGADMGVPARAAELLGRSRAYLSVGHDEYWSYEQREAVEAARDRGVHLNFWSANEAYWAIRFERSPFEASDVSPLEPPRTLVVYKESQSSTKLDPKEGAWTGTFRDSRPINPRGAMPENALSGTMFAVNAQRMDPLVVDGHRFGQHRAWRGTRAARASPSDAPLVLHAGLLGHEWDEDVDNGWRPAALQTLSETTVDNVQLIQDHGATFDTATATHSLVLHRRGNGSGAFVFGAGTVQWAWGLDPHHDVNDPQRANKYSIRVATDARGACRDVQQLTVNVLSDMNVLPTSLEEGLQLFPASTDSSPPTGGTPVAAHAVGVDPVDAYGSEITCPYSKAHPAASTSPIRMVNASGWAEDEGGVVASVEVGWKVASGEEQWHPARLERLASVTRWSFAWGHDAWQLKHGQLPESRDTPIRLRIADDSGNLAFIETESSLLLEE